MRRTVLLLLLCAVTAVVAPAQTFTKLYDFHGYTDGGYPYGSLVQGADGSYYGEAIMDGVHGSGTIFKITSKGVLTTLHQFDFNAHEPEDPFGGLAQGKDGNFYGTSSGGGLSHVGTAFKITPDGTLTILHSFCTQAPCNDGAGPRTALTQGSDGSFYGTTSYAGSSDCNNGCGTVFKMTADGLITTLHMFQGTDGFDPEGKLLLASDGNFYGTTVQGGNFYNNCGWGCGTIFKMTPAGVFSTLYIFCTQQICLDGAKPTAGLIQGKDGNLYGTTYAFGSQFQDYGTIFKITLQGELTKLYTFNGTDGARPLGELLQAPDGNFYGTTFSGGLNNYGTIFRITPTGTLTTLYNFCGQPQCLDGSWPIGALTLGSDGLLYSTTETGGTNVGTVFSLDVGFVPLSVTEVGSGTVISGDNHIYCGKVCSNIYVHDTQVGLTAIPAPGSTFSGWSGCDNTQGSFCLVTMSSARNVSASFSSAQVLLTSLLLNPASVKGGQFSVATVSLNAPAPPGGVGVSMSSDNSQVAHPPSLVVIPGGRTSISFAVRTSAVRTKTLVNITASAGGSQVSTMLTVTTGSSQGAALR